MEKERISQEFWTELLKRGVVCDGTTRDEKVRNWGKGVLTVRSNRRTIFRGIREEATRDILRELRYTEQMSK